MKTKGLWIFFAALIALLLASCTQIPPETQPTQQDATTVPTAAPTTAPTTVPPTEAPTDPPMPDWMREPVYPSYEELFSEDRKYESYLLAPYGDPRPFSWFVMDGKTGIEYTLTQGPEETDNNALYVNNTADNTSQLVLRFADPAFAKLVGCDGRYAYLVDLIRINNQLCQIRQIDLLTEKTQIVAEAKRFLDVHICGDTVLYYASYDDITKTIVICRVYLPEMKAETLCEFKSYADEFDLEEPQSTTGDIIWGARNPDSGSLEFYRYSLSDGSISPAHDSNTQRIDTAPSTLINSPWQPLTGAEIQGTPAGGKPHRLALPRIDGEGLYPGKLYLVSEGHVTQLLDEPVIQVRDFEDAVYCVTEDNRLLQISYDGSVCNTLYHNGGKPLKILGMAGENLLILEENTLLRIDAANARFCALLSHDPEAEIIAWEIDDENTLLLCVYRTDSFLRVYFNLDTGEFREDLESHI